MLSSNCHQDLCLCVNTFRYSLSQYRSFFFLHSVYLRINIWIKAASHTFGVQKGFDLTINFEEFMRSIQYICFWKIWKPKINELKIMTISTRTVKDNFRRKNHWSRNPNTLPENRICFEINRKIHFLPISICIQLKKRMIFVVLVQKL